MTKTQNEIKAQYEQGEEDALFGVNAQDSNTQAYYAGYASIDQSLLL